MFDNCCGLKIEAINLNGDTFENNNVGKKDQVLTVVDDVANLIGWRDPAKFIQEPAKQLATTTLPVTIDGTSPANTGQILTISNMNPLKADWKDPTSIPSGEDQIA